MSRVLVVFYTRSGNTREIGSQLAAALRAEVEEITDPTPRSGLFGYLRSGRQAFFHRTVPIGPSVHRPSDYDLVVIGTPIWNASLSAPVRSYIRRHKTELPAVAFFLTCGGMAVERVFGEMLKESGRTPVARLAVREADLKAPATLEDITRFAQKALSVVGGLHRRAG